MPYCIEIILNQRTRVTEQKHATHLTPLSNGSLILLNDLSFMGYGPQSAVWFKGEKRG